ncbi:hypothetical protein [Lacticaseibacillus suibinensis]|uniref:hypothetical protein n=1 Tax=Lacticaseibacillus suibinensis TaxID=2486011 RepID=UPI0019412BEE|nr:hypothetical protein [Lacticaseibacillus suibinensis]
MVNKKVVVGITTWAVLATGAAGVGWYQASQSSVTPQTHVVIKKQANGTSNINDSSKNKTTNISDQADAKELASIKASDATISKRAKAFVTLNTQYYDNAQQHHDDIEAISNKKIADDLVVVPTGGMAADNYRWGTVWYTQDVQIQPGNGSERQVTVRVIFDLSGAGNNNPQKQDTIYRLNFKDNKITEWSEYVYAQMEPGVPLNQQ